MKSEVRYVDEFFELTTHGDADLGGQEELFDLLLGHEKWNLGAAYLVDHSELNAGPLTVAEVRGIAKMCEKRRAELGRARCAILVGRELEYGMTRMWEVFVDGKWDVTEKLFRSRDEAISWLKNS